MDRHPLQDLHLLLMPAGIVACAVCISWLGLTLLFPRAKLPGWKKINPPAPGLLIIFFILLCQVLPVWLSHFLEGSSLWSWVAPHHALHPVTPEWGAVLGAAALAFHEDQQQVLALVKSLWGRLLAFPVLLVCYGAIIFPDFRKKIACLHHGVAQLKWGLLAWFIFFPGALAVNALAQTVMYYVEIPVDEHPLSQLSRHSDGMGGLVFFLVSCLLQPALEEIVFRGLLLPWAVQRLPRMWSILALSGFLAVFLGGISDTGLRYGPSLFIVTIALVFYFLVRQSPSATLAGIKIRRYTWGANIAVSAMFAIIHVTVWPTPIALFFLSIGLNALMLRTGSLWAPLLLHALFNTVAFLQVVSSS